MVCLGVQSCVVFFGYALLFSRAGISAWYARTRGLFSGVLAVVFGIFSLKVVTTELETS